MIFMCSYGSGAGSDAFIWKVTDRDRSGSRPGGQDARNCWTRMSLYIDYGTYAKFRHKIIKND